MIPAFVFTLSPAPQPFKEVLRYDVGDAVRHDHIAVSELPDISPVVEYMPHAVGGRFLPSHVGKPLLVTPIHNEGNGFCAVISLEGFLHERAVSGSIRRR